MPTILALAGLSENAPSGMEGTSLAPMMRGEALRLPVFVHGMLYGSTERGLIDGRFKLMYDEQLPNFRLYDVFADPGESMDLAESEPALVRSMARRLDEWQGGVELEYDELSREQQINDTDDQKDLEALRALGYVADENEQMTKAEHE
jgi:arylsulfatase A-like enzyme